MSHSARGEVLAGDASRLSVATSLAKTVGGRTGGDEDVGQEPNALGHGRGEREADGGRSEGPGGRLSRLRRCSHGCGEDTRGVGVFLKETTDDRVREVILADRRFLAEARHAFLIRVPRGSQHPCTR